MKNYRNSQHNNPDIKSYEWNQLVKSICSNEVIPVIGEELLLVDSDLVFEIYSQILFELNINDIDLRQLQPLSLEKVSRYILQKNIDSAELARVLGNIFEKNTFSTIPGDIQTLSEIEDFKFYITTSIDPFLENAIQKKLNRNQSDYRLEIISNKFNQPKDISFELNTMDHPVLYYLFGKINYHHDYVITEDNIDVFKYLVENGANTNTKDAKGINIIVENLNHLKKYQEKDFPSEKKISITFKIKNVRFLLGQRLVAKQKVHRLTANILSTNNNVSTGRILKKGAFLQP